MKIALYIEDGLEQVVLTPESKTEVSILGKLHDGSRALEIKRGSFYECRGGYVRHSAPSRSSPYGGDYDSGGDSTMIVLRPVVQQQPQPEDVYDHGQPGIDAS